MSITWMQHPQHGKMPCYTSLEVDANKKNGWSLDPTQGLPPGTPAARTTADKDPQSIPDQDHKAASDRMAAARAALAAKRANDK